MQIAKIVPKVMTRGEGIFDYAIPPQILPDIKIGVLVLVPFHGRKVEGIVIGIKRASSITNIKPIISVIDTVPVIDQIHTELARWMSDYYLTPFSKCLFEMIVPPAKRTIKKMEHIQNIAVRTSKFGNDNKARKYLIMADFPTRLKFYLQAIKKTVDRGQQVIILVPDLSLIPYFTKFLNNRISILHAGLTRTQRWQEWDKIRKGDINIVIGSNSALFAPVKNLGLIIIDQEENETYKSGQSPRYHAVRVAGELTRLTTVRLVLGSLTPRVETFYDAVKNKYLFSKPPHVPSVSIVDMNFERQAISFPLQQKIDEMLSAKQKIILVLNRKGEGSTFRCANCNWIQTCPQCNLPLIPQNDKTICFNCEKKFDLAEQCPKCQSFQLKAMGLTTKKLEKFARDLWPQAKVIRIEKNGLISQNNFDIAIVTNFALKFNFTNIGLVGIIDADQGLNFPDFRAAEKNFQNLYKFLRLAKEGIVQTHLPENPAIMNLAQMDYEKFALSEISSRENTQFPPFTHLARLLYRNIDEKLVHKEAQKVAELLPQTNILGPSTPFISRQRGYYYEQIIIKYDKELPEETRIILKSLPKGWMVDIDPYDLI